MSDVVLAAVIVFGGAAACVATLYMISIFIDVRKKSKTAKRAARVVGVRLGAIKNKDVRERLKNNRAIIHAMNEMALAHKEKHDTKVEQRGEELTRWNREFDAALGKPVIEDVPVYVRRADWESLSARKRDELVMADWKRKAELIERIENLRDALHNDAALPEPEPQKIYRGNNGTIRIKVYDTWR